MADGTGLFEHGLEIMKKQNDIAEWDRIRRAASSSLIIKHVGCVAAMCQTVDGSSCSLQKQSAPEYPAFSNYPNLMRLRQQFFPHKNSGVNTHLISLGNSSPPTVHTNVNVLSCRRKEMSLNTERICTVLIKPRMMNLIWQDLIFFAWYLHHYIFHVLHVLHVWNYEIYYCCYSRNPIQSFSVLNTLRCQIKCSCFNSNLAYIIALWHNLNVLAKWDNFRFFTFHLGAEWNTCGSGTWLNGVPHSQIQLWLSFKRLELNACLAK